MVISSSDRDNDSFAHSSVMGAHALIDAYGGFYMMNDLLEALSDPSAKVEHKWGSESSRLFQSLDAYTETLRQVKDGSEKAETMNAQANEDYKTEGSVSNFSYFISVPNRLHTR